MCQTTVTVDHQNNEEKNKMTVCNIIYKSSYKKDRGCIIHVFIQQITMISRFDELSDLSLLEIFSYLSSADALWSFSNLNTHLTTLLIEGGFYRHVNLSSTRKKVFTEIFSILRLNEIQSLVIDRCTSPLQIRRWPHLTNLTTLRLEGVRNFRDVFRLIRKHANTLTHLTIESSSYYHTVSNIRSNIKCRLQYTI
jgi:hypothetical protein